MTRRFFICVLYLCLGSLPAIAQWQRIVTTDKGGIPDISQPHPLSCWTNDPILRNETNDFCLGSHLDNGHAITEKDYKSECKVTDLGKLANYSIKQFLCHFTGNAEVSGVFSTEDYKFILVQTGSDQFREIYHLQVWGNTFMPLKPARIIDMDTESILVTFDPDSGNGGGCSEGYWFFDAAGPHQLNFNAVREAISQHLPHNVIFPMSCWALDLEHQQIKTWAQRADAKCRLCGGIGEVTAHFTLHGANAEPTEIEGMGTPEPIPQP
jgi:hypothetical protein